VNARVRKPLEPVAVQGPEPWEPLVASLLASGATEVHAPATVASPAALERVAARIARSERGVIACGPASLARADQRDAILDLARRTGFVLLAEATSQLRFGGDRAGVLEGGPFDALFRIKLAAPDLVVQLGAPPTSTAYADLCARGVARVVIAEHGWSDPQGNAAAMIEADPGAFAAAILPRIAPRPASRWALTAAREAALAQELAQATVARSALFEGSIASALVGSCPEAALLVVGNSTPVRDLDLFCPPSRRGLRVVHQRGASGIDGLVSGAAGAAIAAGCPAALLLGDLSLLHDLTGLGLLARARQPLVVVAVQNGGGRIFDQLPVAKRIDEATFERLFGTAQPVHLDRAAAAFDVPFARAATRAELDAALAEAWSRRGPTLLEAVAAPRERARIIERLWADFAQRPREARGNE
jgi:2-succinyl-5-enolpyruvyl-6-hydroxy-3-cyclohexene-1-carboxylate synthase